MGSEAEGVTSSKREGGTSRRFVWLATAIVAAIALYTGGWYYAADALEQATDTWLTRMNERGASASCEQRQARGYPFRIGLFCSKAAIADAEGRFAVRADGLRSAAQVYNPAHIVGELDAIRLDLFAAANPVGASASDIRFSARRADPLPQSASVTARQVALDATPEGRVASVLFEAGHAEAHTRRNGADLDLALSAEAMTARPPQLGREIRAERFQADLTVADGVRLAVERPQSLRGISLVIRDLAITLADKAGFALSGPLSVDIDGLIDAKLQISAQNPQKLATLLAEIMPENGDQIRSVAAGLAALGDNPSLPLTVTKGQARIAFITLGRIPPLN